ncbi:MAG: Glu-tRNA(Gln) amidotransferase subunit GatE, partial [Thermoplasmatota archaeon]
MTLDYAALGFKAGLEIHQQLATKKLFCSCPSELDESEDILVFRALRPTSGELGEIDRAAVAEARKDLAFEYVGSRATTCLVELDEEPPHPLTAEAVDVSLVVSLLLNMRPVDEVHVMRKIVIDGSNTSGFQRTSLLATDGHLESSKGRIGVATLCLEEDAARRVERKGNVVRFRLDRLGIPLVEIATAPDIKDGEHAREVAETIGMLLRATGRVKRGIGTIRQDLNISIRDGARIEVKGVQELRLIPAAVDYEVARQVMLVALRDHLREGERVAVSPRDVTVAFRHTGAKHVKRALESESGVAWAIPLPRLAGKLGKKSAGPGPRFGKELADYAKVASGVGGLFHSDELPDYGITDEEVAAVRGALQLAAADAFALVAADRASVEKALAAVAARYAQAFD